MDEEIKGKRSKKKYGVFQEFSKRHGALLWTVDVNYFIHGERFRKRQTGFRNKREAEDYLHDLYEIVKREKEGIGPPRKVKTTTIKKAAEDYIQSKKSVYGLREPSPNPNARTFHGYLKNLERFVEFIGEDTPVKKISHDDFVRWMAAEKDRGSVQLSSISRGINTIRACLNHAKDNPKNDDLINFRVPKKPLGKGFDNKRVRILSAKEIETLSEALSSSEEYRDAYDYLLISLGAGTRMDEVLGLTWDRVDWERKSINVYSSKTKKFRILQVPAVVEISKQRKKEHLGSLTHVFDRRDHWFRKIFKRVAQQNDLLFGQNIEGGFTLHDLRHTAATNLIHAGVDLATVRDFLGHHSIVETSRYVHPSPDSWKKATDAATLFLEAAKNKQD